MRIRIERHELSDLSEVFDVVLHQGDAGGDSVRFHACSERDANALSDGLMKLIDDHACEIVDA